jgi:hypothetical protein
MIIKVKLDVTKVEKARLFQGKNGAKYLDITLLENKNGTDQYGNNFMVVQDVSKQEREAGVKGPILGNGKIMGQSQTPPRAPQAQQSAPQAGGQSDEVQF